MRPVYITGHKNPDTDSIVSSIAYAEYKRQKTGLQYIASRIGPVNSDTEWLLERFHFEDPLHIFTAKSTIREIDFDKGKIVSKDTTIKEAIDEIKDLETKTLFIADKNRKLEGMVTTSGITGLWILDDRRFAKILKTATLKNIKKILRAKTESEASKFELNGYIALSPAEGQEYTPGTIVITSGQAKILKAIDCHAGLVIAVNGVVLTDEMFEKARENDVPIISTSIPAYKVSTLICLTPTIESIMKPADELVCIRDSMTTDEATSLIINSRYRSYPIIDGHGLLIGALSRYHLLSYKKKKLILVDHNEKKQSIDDIEYGEVIEIVDHHRFGGFQSDNPINITTMIVGATCSIIASKFIEDNLKLSEDMAGLLLGGIVADTMNFKSPTTTKFDVETAKKLQKICNVKPSELNKGLIQAAASLTTKKAIDIVSDDFKEFDVHGLKVGLSQAVCKSYEEYKSVKNAIMQHLEESCTNSGYDLMAIMLTDPFGSGSYLLYAGKRSDLIEKAFAKMDDNSFVNHLVSRKKQLLPGIAGALNG